MNGEDENKKKSSRESWISSVLPESLAKPLNEVDKAINPFRKISDFLESPTRPKKKDEEEETLPRRRKGGPVRKNKAYLVGEEGPEIFVPEENGRIIPNRKTRGEEMPARSKKQQRLMGMARAIQKGEMSPSGSPEAARIARSMKPGDLEEFASTPHKGLPEKVGRKNSRPSNPKAKQPKRPSKSPAESEATMPSPPMPTIPPAASGPPESPPRRTKPPAIKMPPGEPAPPPSPPPVRVPKRTMNGILSDLKRSRRKR